MLDGVEVSVWVGSGDGSSDGSSVGSDVGSSDDASGSGSVSITGASEADSVLVAEASGEGVSSPPSVFLSTLKSNCFLKLFKGQCLNH